MTFLVERLAELRKHIDHLRGLRPRINGRDALDNLEPVQTFLETVAGIEAE